MQKTMAATMVLGSIRGKELWHCPHWVVPQDICPLDPLQYTTVLRLKHSYISNSSQQW